MRKLILSIICLLVLSPDALAHPPTKMTLRYNKASKQLTVVLNHRTSKGGKDKRRKHYIEEVSLLQNDEIVDTETFKFQQNESVVNATLNVPEYKEDDVFTVKAKDSIGSEETKTFSAKDLPRYEIYKESSSH